LRSLHNKYLNLIVLVLAVVFSFQINIYGAAVAEYMFEEGSGTAAGDTGGSGNNAAFAGSPIWAVGHTAESLYAIQFTGDDYLTAPDSASLDSMTSAFSMTAWIKTDASSTTDTIVWKTGAFHIWKSNTNLMVTLEGVSTVADYVIISGVMANNVWQHIAVTYDGLYIAGYVNGTRLRRVRVNSSSAPISTSNQPLQIGWHSSSPFYRGLLDNVRLYNHKLSDTEVVTDMNDNAVSIPQPLVVVQAGAANTAIVIPNSASWTIQNAANELSNYILKASGAAVGVYAESSAPTGYSGLIYIGPCQATKNAGIEGNYLAANAYVIRSVGNNLFMAGSDAGSLTGTGTEFAVYAFEDEQLGVRWLWPADSGLYVPQKSDIVINPLNQIYIPQLLHSRLRTNGYINYYEGWATAADRDNFIGSQDQWMLHHRLGRVTSLEYPHAYEGYWDLYHTAHLEYFNLLPDGTRRSDPYYAGGYKTYVSMNVSNAGLHSQIVTNWIAEGADGTSWINGCENDTPGKCTCASCMAWDVEPPNFQSEYGCLWSQRLAYATNAFNSANADWANYLGPVSDRYAKFWLALQQEAVSRGYSDAAVIGYAYLNYAKPPVAMQNQLNERINVLAVPWYHYPWTNARRQELRDQWTGWNDTGASLYLRPNYTLEGHNFPLFYAKAFGEDFCYGYERGMKGTDFDALNGQFATQSPTLYMLARIHNQAGVESANPIGDITGNGKVDLYDLSELAGYWLNSNCAAPQECKAADLDNSGTIDFNDFAKLAANWQTERQTIVNRILDEFYGAFGPAQAAVRNYFEYTEWLFSDDQVHFIDPVTWWVGAEEVFTPVVMNQLRVKMNTAVAAAAGNADAMAKVGFLEKGLTNLEKTYAASKAWQTYGNGSVQFNTAVNDLDNYRASVESYGICNMAYLYFWENVNWTRP